MRVLHFLSNDVQSGAGLGTLRLHLALLDLGVDSFLVAYNRDENFHCKNLINLNRFKERWKRKINVSFNEFQLKRYDKKNDGFFTTGNEPFNIFSIVNLSAGDILHLHWPNYGISLQEIKELSEKYNVFWTLRDMWPFTGGCHYSLDCERYIDGCGHCPILNSDLKEDISAINLMKKTLMFQNIKFVAISDWMKEEAKKSPVLKSKCISRIYNSVDDTYFDFSVSKNEARRLLQIETKKPVLLFGSHNVLDPYKGAEIFKSIYELYHEDFMFLVFGKNSEKIVGQRKGEFKVLGVLNAERIKYAYVAADAFLMLSTQEGFGKTIIESFSLGTPVVTLPNGAPEEIGKLYKDYHKVYSDSVDIRGVIDSLIEKHDKNEMKRITKDIFSTEKIAKEYNELYKSSAFQSLLKK